MPKQHEFQTGLIQTGTAEIGKHLIKAAQQKNRENVQAHIVGKVQEFLVMIDKQRRYIARSQDNVRLLQKKLAAIEAGAFSVSTYGNVLTFTDPEVNDAVTSMDECINCGMPRHQRTP